MKKNVLYKNWSYWVRIYTWHFVKMWNFTKNFKLCLKLVSIFQWIWIKYQYTSYTKQILPVSTFMDSNGFKIGSPLEEISRIKVGTPTAEHPVAQFDQQLSLRSGRWKIHILLDSALLVHNKEQKI